MQQHEFEEKLIDLLFEYQGEDLEETVLVALGEYMLPEWNNNIGLMLFHLTKYTNEYCRDMI